MAPAALAEVMEASRRRDSLCIRTTAPPVRRKATRVTLLKNYQKRLSRSK